MLFLGRTKGEDVRHELTKLIAAARRQERIQDGTATPQDIELERRNSEVMTLMASVDGELGKYAALMLGIGFRWRNGRALGEMDINDRHFELWKEEREHVLTVAENGDGMLELLRCDSDDSSFNRRLLLAVGDYLGVPDQPPPPISDELQELIADARRELAPADNHQTASSAKSDAHKKEREELESFLL